MRFHRNAKLGLVGRLAIRRATASPMMPAPTTPIPPSPHARAIGERRRFSSISRTPQTRLRAASRLMPPTPSSQRSARRVARPRTTAARPPVAQVATTGTPDRLDSCVLAHGAEARVYANGPAGVFDGDARSTIRRAWSGPGGRRVDALVPCPGQSFVVKPRSSAFDSTRLTLILRDPRDRAGRPSGDDDGGLCQTDGGRG